MWLKVSSVMSAVETLWLSTGEDGRLICSDRSGFNIWMLQSEFGINNLGGGAQVQPIPHQHLEERERERDRQSPAGKPNPVHTIR